MRNQQGKISYKNQVPRAKSTSRLLAEDSEAGIDSQSSRDARDERTAQQQSHESSISSKCSVYLSDLHWWTSDQQIADACSAIGAHVSVDDICFSEHKVNGKSKGVAHVAFKDSTAAETALQFFQTSLFQNKQISAVIVANSEGLGRPFQTLPKIDAIDRNASIIRQVSGPPALQMNRNSQVHYAGLPQDQYSHSPPSHNQPCRRSFDGFMLYPAPALIHAVPSAYSGTGLTLPDPGFSQNNAAAELSG